MKSVLKKTLGILTIIVVIYGMNFIGQFYVSKAPLDEALFISAILSLVIIGIIGIAFLLGTFVSWCFR